MKTTITEIKGTDLLKIQLEKGLAHRIDRVSRLAKRLLSQDQVRTDAHRCDPDMLEFLERGTQALALLAKTITSQLTVDPVFLLDAHTAASLMAGRTTSTKQEREDVQNVLGFLAELLPLYTTGMRLPRWEDFQTGDAGSEHGKQIYDKLRRQDTSITGLRQITLADALVLRECLRLLSHPKILELWKDLDHITATHRHAVSQLARGHA